MYSIIKSPKFRPGICSIRVKLNGDKKRAVAFEQGKEIKVTEDEYKAIDKVGWCEIPAKKEGDKKCQQES